MNMGQLIRQDEEIRRDWPAWPQGATSAHIEGVGQVFRGVHGDTPSESSGDDHLPGLPDDGQPVNQSATVTAAQSPAAQWLNASLKAHPGSCHPCWFTAKGSGCQREGCLFCHKPHVPADVRHPGGRLRQRVAKRNGRDHSRVQKTTHIHLPRTCKHT